MSSEVPIADDLDSDKGTDSGSVARDQPRPRVWTVFVVVFGALILAILFQTVFVVAIVAIQLANGVLPKDLPRTLLLSLTSPYVMIATLAVSQFAFGMSAMLPARMSREATGERLGLRRARPDWRVYPMAMLGSIFPLAVGLVAAQAMALLLPEDQSFATFFEALTIETGILFVVFIGVAPGICEELLFRGYMQQRLVKRWGPAAGIIVTSVIFGLFHVTPPAIAVAMPLGFWFGYIAWCSKSIFPTILCHLFVNSGLNAWRLVVQFGEVSETNQAIFHVAALVVGAVCFTVCFWPKFWNDEQNSDVVAETIEE